MWAMIAKFRMSDGSMRGSLLNAALILQAKRSSPFYADTRRAHVHDLFGNRIELMEQGNL